ncbi:hypothetical protein F4861DRAFT_536196 [Xylaria intraflava]|nr:hypothetical protein F4861DRAFT_536196 [Xylaria intraflava]
MSSQLLSLPREVMGEICNHLLNDYRFRQMIIFNDITVRAQDMQALLRLSITCRTLHYVVAPFLTKLRELPPPKEFKHNLVGYACNIIQDPTLAAREQYLHVDISVPFGPVRPGDAEILDDASRKLSLMEPSRWLNSNAFEAYQDFHSESDDDDNDDDDDGDTENNDDDESNSDDEASDDSDEDDLDENDFFAFQGMDMLLRFIHKSELVVLTLRSLPNLTSLTIADDFLLYQLSPRCLPSLREIRLSGETGSQDEPVQPCDVAIFESLFYAAPNIERLTVENCVACTSSLKFDNLLSLEVIGGCLSTSDANRLMRRCEKLKRFKYESIEYGSPLHMDPFLVEAHPACFLEALLASSSTLEEIHMRLRPDLAEAGEMGNYHDLVFRLPQYFPTLREAVIENMAAP